MINPAQIPDEVVEAGAKAAHDVWRRQASVGDDIAEYAPWHEMSADLQDEYLDQARAACLAMLENWPGMRLGKYRDVAGDNDRIILPLPPQEASDE
jgi:hypothetical protein